MQVDIITQQRKAAYYCIVGLEKVILPDTFVDSSLALQVRGPGVELRKNPVVQCIGSIDVAETAHKSVEVLQSDQYPGTRVLFCCLTKEYRVSADRFSTPV